MKLRAIRLSDVRGFAQKAVAFEAIADGMNVIAEANEYGKSTIFDALIAVLFHKASSRNAEVRGLSPYGGGAPTVEVDLETEEGLFRVHKRFLSSPAASVTALPAGRQIAAADAAQDWLSGILDGAQSGDGPTGLLWVQQGHSLASPASVGDRGGYLARFLDQEVGAAVGGGGLARVLRSVDQRLDGLVTSGQQRPRFAYKDAVDARDRLDREVTEITSRVNEVERLLLDLREIDHQLAELEGSDTDKEVRARVEQARVAELAAREARGEISRLQTSAESIQADADRAQAGAQLLAKAQMDARARSDARDALALALIDIQKRETDIATRAAEADQLCSAAMISVDEARRTLNAQQLIAQTRIARGRADSLTTALAEALAVRSRIEDLRGRLGVHLVGPGEMDALEAAAEAARTAQARLEVSRPTVVIDYVPGATAKVVARGQPLKAGDVVTVDGRLPIQIEGVGTLTIEAGEGREVERLQAESEAAQTSLSTLLGTVRCADLSSARTQFRERPVIAAEIEAAEREFTRLAPNGVEALRAELSAAENQLGENIPEDVEEIGEPMARQALDDAELTLEAARTNRDGLRDRHASAREELAGCKAQLAGLSERIANDNDELGLPDSWPNQLTALRKAADDAIARATAAAVAYRDAEANAPDLDAAVAERERLEQQLENRRARLTRLGSERARLRGLIEAAQAEGVEELLAMRRDELVATNMRVAAFDADVRALRLLGDTVRSQQAEIREQYFAPVMRELQPLLGQVLTDSELVLGDGFVPSHLRRNGREEPCESLSGGTREQIAILTRLAFARMMARKGRAMPVILDDAIVYSDDERIERMFTALTMAARDVQMIVLTCRQRAFDGLGGNVLVAQPWLR